MRLFHTSIHSMGCVQPQLFLPCQPSRSPGSLQGGKKGGEVGLLLRDHKTEVCAGIAAASAAAALLANRQM